ncbi:hypothetical protein [Xylophilus sp. ASV27]|uniref:hypothetical protein n=1 Tax=Xylophilus sp. ASV27 TaxID=2795129 RepID=UPI0018EBB52D|nr:hypothetical protein [Xylophilus sp. ASV27]
MQIPPADLAPYRPPQAAGVAVSGADGSAGAALRAGVTQADPGKARDFIGAPQGARSPDNSPSSSAETPNRDWTTVRQKETAKEPEEPPKEPIGKQLFEQIQSLWRASALIVDIAEEQQRKANQESLLGTGSANAAPVVYADPSKVRRSPPRSGL